jgi:hypothetical protein
VSHAFEIFDKNSRGNFHHFSKLFGELLRNEPLKLCGFLVGHLDEKQMPIVMKMTDHLHQAVIGPLVLGLIGMPASTNAQRTKKREVLEALASHRFIERILENLGNRGRLLKRMIMYFFSDREVSWRLLITIGYPSS